MASSGYFLYDSEFLNNPKYKIFNSKYQNTELLTKEENENNFVQI